MFFKKTKLNYNIFKIHINNVLHKFISNVDLFNKILYNSNGIIFGDSILGMLDLININYINTLKIAISFSKSKNLIKFFKNQGFLLFVYNDRIVLSNNVLFEVGNTFNISKICNCNNLLCTNLCINGTIELYLFDDIIINVQKYIMNIAKFSFHKIIFNGIQITGDFIDLTLKKKAYTSYTNFINKYLGFTIDTTKKLKSSNNNNKFILDFFKISKLDITTYRFHNSYQKCISI